MTAVYSSPTIEKAKDKVSRKVLIKGEEYYMDGYLKRRCDLMKEYQNKDFDVSLLVDGQEGSGKSTLALFIAYYLTNGEFGVDNIIEGEKDIVRKLEKAKKGDVLLIDEGFLMFSSKNSMQKRQKSLITILSVIRQKNIILIIVAPSFFELNKYVAVHRTKCLLHVYSKGFSRGRFSYFDEKKKKTLYLLGKKRFNNYNVTRATFNGSFTNFIPPFYAEYKKAKERSLLEAFKQGYDAQKGKSESDIKAELCYNLKKNKPELLVKDLAEQFGVTRQTISKWIKTEEKKENLLVI